MTAFMLYFQVFVFGLDIYLQMVWFLLLIAYLRRIFQPTSANLHALYIKEALLPPTMYLSNLLFRMIMNFSWSSCCVYFEIVVNITKTIASFYNEDYVKFPFIEALYV